MARDGETTALDAIQRERNGFEFGFARSRVSSLDERDSVERLVSEIETKKDFFLLFNNFNVSFED